jgi:hypothetical protein
MPDDLLKKAREGRSRISTEPDQVQYWADKFGVSKERLLEAVRKAGFAPEAIGRELKRAVSKDRNGGSGRKPRAF